MAISTGWQNALANPNSPPSELAPTRQIQYQWPKFGQFAETAGRAGAAPNTAAARKLLQLLDSWAVAALPADSSKI